jgi:hypothetical protein
LRLHAPGLEQMADVLPVVEQIDNERSGIVSVFARPEGRLRGAVMASEITDD